MTPAILTLPQENPHAIGQ